MTFSGAVYVVAYVRNIPTFKINRRCAGACWYSAGTARSDGGMAAEGGETAAAGVFSMTAQ
jgi:hypothetical protein